MSNDLPKGKPILSLDFDGVIHSYSSGWKGAAVIPDPIIPGAIEFMLNAMEHFKVAIFSSRSHQWGGRRAMKRYLKNEFIKIGLSYDRPLTVSDFKNPIFKFINAYAFADPWEDEVEYAATKFISSISFPFFKPPAFLMIDDRGLQFTGAWPNVEELLKFRPWNKRKEC